MRTASCEATRVRHEQPEETLALRAACPSTAGAAGGSGALTELFLRADKKSSRAPRSAAASALGDLEDCADVTALARPLPSSREPAESRRGSTRRSARIDEAEAQERAGVVTRATLELATRTLEELPRHRPRAQPRPGPSSSPLAPRAAWGITSAGNGALRRRAQRRHARGRDTRQAINALSCLTQMVEDNEYGGRTEEGLRYARLALSTIEGFEQPRARPDRH